MCASRSFQGSWLFHLLRLSCIGLTLYLHEVESANFDFRSCTTFYSENPGPDYFAPACPGHKHRTYTDNTNTRYYSSKYPSIKIAYIDFPPYIYNDGNPSQPRGIWVDFIEDFIKRACPNVAGRFDWNRYQYKTARELQNYCRTNQYACGMSVPSVGYKSDTVVNRNEFASFFSTQGVAFITIHKPLVEQVLPKFVNDVKSMWPFIVLLFTTVFFAGVFIWILETKANPDEFPIMYYNGIWNGMWCAFVSMTTVGYGDRTPATSGGRVFSIFWLIFGIAMFSILTSMLSGALIGAIDVPEVVISGNMVGVLGITQVAKQAVAKNEGFFKVANDINELVQWFEDGEIAGIAMDTRELEYHWKQTISKRSVVNSIFLERIYGYDKEYGLSVYASNLETEHYRNINPVSSQPWDDCMRWYVQDNDEHAEAMENHYISTENLRMNGTWMIPRGSESFSIMDADSDLFKDITRVSGYVILTIMLVGIVYEIVRRKWFYKKPVDDLDVGNDDDDDESGLTDAEQSSMTREERRIHKIVMKSIGETNTLIKEYEKNMMTDLFYMSTMIRKQMKAMKDLAK